MNIFYTAEGIENLSFFDKYQGKTISINDAKKIKSKQQEIIKLSFSQGFDKIKSIDKTEITSELIGYVHKVDQGYFLDNPEMFKQEQDQLYNLIHTSDLSYTHKIFYEYLIGLSRFMLSIQLLYSYVKYIRSDLISYNFKTYSSKIFIQDNNYSLTLYFNRVSIMSDIGKILISFLSEHYFQDNFTPEKYWSNVEQYFFQHPNLDILAKNLASIQYVPEDRRYLGIMQSLHWQGFGGTGDLLLKFDPLKKLVVHSISHHNAYNTSSAFNKRLLVFKLPLETILAKTQMLIYEYLNRYFPSGLINIHDFCSGPKFIAVKAIIEREKKRKFDLTVSDIDGSSLISLLKEKCNYENLNSYEVRYEDLCLPLKINESQLNKHHLVSINLGLHQLPIEEIYASIRYFAEITKIGGLIANLDASERRYLQLMVIPGNLVDREGHVPYIEQMELAKLVVSSQNSTRIRIAYPLVNLSRKVFIGLDNEIEVGPYMVAFYTPIVITQLDFDLLHELWSFKRYDDCDKLVKPYLEHLL